jgi:flagellar M-ring protein FliF
MNQLKQLVARLSMRQRITVAVAAVLVALGLFYFAGWKKDRDFKPLFTNLAAEDAGQVVTRIRESGVEYRLSENGTTILIPSAKVAELRLQLASAGLPKTGRIGYELFDKTNFGVTDFAEQVNFHRALEGELERSVMSLAEVEQARVHITFPKDSIYTENREAAKASVLVKLRLGAHLSAQNVVAICHLTSSAVEGLTPDEVSVLDMNGNLLSRVKKPGLPDGPEPNDAILEYKQKIERDLLNKLTSTFDPMLGQDTYRVGLTIDCDFTSGEQSEEIFDPSKSVMVTSQRSDDASSGLIASGVPGTASNLPRPTSRPSTGNSGNSRRTENISYQSSRMVKRLKLPQGNIKRISLSIILDQSVRFEKGKKIIEPPSPEKLKVVKDLAAGLVGIQPDRGDQVIVETLPFDATLKIQPPAPPTAAAPAPNAPPAPNWMPAWLQEAMRTKNFFIYVGIGAGVALLLMGATFWLILRMIKKKKKIAAKFGGEVEAGGTRAIAGSSLEQELEAKIAEQAALKEKQAKEVLNSLKLPAVTTKKAEILVKSISAEAKKDPTALVQVIRTWLNNPDYEH